MLGQLGVSHQAAPVPTSSTPGLSPLGPATSPSWGTLRGAGPAPPVRKPCTTLGARCPPALAPGSSAADWSSEVPWDTILSGKLGIKRPIILGRLAAAEQWKTNYCIPSPVVAPGFTQPLVQGDLGEKAAPKRNPPPAQGALCRCCSAPGRSTLSSTQVTSVLHFCWQQQHKGQRYPSTLGADSGSLRASQSKFPPSRQAALTAKLTSDSLKIQSAAQASSAREPPSIASSQGSTGQLKQLVWGTLLLCRA